MFKLLFTGLLVYFLYRTFFGTPSLKGSPKREEKKIPTNSEKNNDIEYTDYEEVD